MKKKVGLDLDNTLADFIGGVIALVGKEPVDLASGKLVKMFPHLSESILDSYVTDPGVYVGLRPILDAAYWVRKLVEENEDVEFEYVTARPVEAVGVSCEWLEQNGFPAGEVVAFGGRLPKARYIMEQQFYAFVDDSLSTIEDITFFVYHRFLFDRPWNQTDDPNGFIRVKSWGEAYRELSSVLQFRTNEKAGVSGVKRL